MNAPAAADAVIPGFRADLLADRIAVVTGAARGIGLATARALAAVGAKVVLADLEGAALAEASKAMGKAPHRTAVVDVASYDSVRRAAEKIEREWGPVSVLVNNAGIFARVPIESADALAGWRDTFATNADGPFHTVRAFLSQLEATKGAVVNVVSVRAYTASERASAYTASKGALVGMTKALAAELAPRGIRVNAVAPSDVKTRMLGGAPDDAAIQAALYARTPLKRPADPEEIAAPIVFLASPLASFVTGTVLRVDGGFLIT